MKKTKKIKGLTLQQYLKRGGGVILTPPTPTDYIAGGITGIAYREVNPTGQWDNFLPTDETQLKNGLDTMSCLSFSALNSIETQIDFMVANNQIPKLVLDQLRAWGFFDANGKFNCSDRFTAKMSKTTPQGNSFQNVWNSIRHDGLVPESMYPSEFKSWNDYFKPISQNIVAFGKKILEILEFQYEFVSAGSIVSQATIQKHHKQAPLQIATGVCPGWSDGGIIQRCNLAVIHATLLYGWENFWKDFDHYEPYRKKLALNYAIPWIMKGIVIVKKKMKTIRTNSGDIYVIGLDGYIRHIRTMQTYNDMLSAGMIEAFENVSNDELKKYQKGRDIYHFLHEE